MKLHPYVSGKTVGSFLRHMEWSWRWRERPCLRLPHRWPHTLAKHGVGREEFLWPALAISSLRTSPLSRQRDPGPNDMLTACEGGDLPTQVDAVLKSLQLKQGALSVIYPPPLHIYPPPTHTGAHEV